MTFFSSLLGLIGVKKRKTENGAVPVPTSDGVAEADQAALPHKRAHPPPASTLAAVAGPGRDKAHVAAPEIVPSTSNRAQAGAAADKALSFKEQAAARGIQTYGEDQPFRAALRGAALPFNNQPSAAQQLTLRGTTSSSESQAAQAAEAPLPATRTQPQLNQLQQGPLGLQPRTTHTTQQANNGPRATQAAVQQQPRAWQHAQQSAWSGRGGPAQRGAPAVAAAPQGRFASSPLLSYQPNGPAASQPAMPPANARPSRPIGGHATRQPTAPQGSAFQRELRTVQQAYGGRPMTLQSYREQVEREIQQPSILRQKAEHAVTSAAFRALQQQPSAFTPSPLQQPNTYTANGVGPSSLQGQRAQPTQQGATEPRYQMASTLPSSDVIEREQAKAHRADRQVEESNKELNALLSSLSARLNMSTLRSTAAQAIQAAAPAAGPSHPQPAPTSPNLTPAPSARHAPATAETGAVASEEIEEIVMLDDSDEEPAPAPAPKPTQPTQKHKQQARAAAPTRGHAAGMAAAVKAVDVKYRESEEGLEILSSSEEECAGEGEEEEYEEGEAEEGVSGEGEGEDLTDDDGEHDYREIESGVRRNSKKERAFYEAIMCDPRDDTTLIAEHERSSLPLTLHSLKTLRDGVWLNDEIINTSMALLQERDWNFTHNADTPRPKGWPKCHFFSSFFLNKLHKDSGKYNYKEVFRWTRLGKLRKYGQACESVLDCDILLFPVHVGQSHWAMACVHLRHRKIYYWDSMRPAKNPPCMEHLARWVVDEAQDKLGKGSAAADKWADAMSWPREMPRVPQQDNYCDCGVFSICFAAFAGAASEFLFGQQDMPTIRRRLLYDLANLRWTLTQPPQE